MRLHCGPSFSRLVVGFGVVFCAVSAMSVRGGSSRAVAQSIRRSLVDLRAGAAWRKR